MTTTSRSLPLVAVVLAVAIVAIYARVVAGGKTWADVRYHVDVTPPRLAAAEAVQGGALPAWWEGTGLGVPLAGEPTHGAMYPPAWLAATPRALDLVAVAHLVWAALGVAIWARRRAAKHVETSGASEPAALVAALLVATSGLLVGAALRGALPALAQLPWIAVAAARLGEAEADDRRARAQATAVLGALVGLAGLAGTLAGLVDALVLAIAVGGRRRTLGWFATAIGAGLAIASAQWLPALRALPAEMGATVDGLPLARLVELIVPGSFGTSDPDRAIVALAGEAAWAPSLFVGAPLLALASVRTPSRRVLAALGTFAVLALVVGRGGWPAWLGAPEQHLAALVVVLASNAGAGFDALARAERRALLALAAGTGCAAIGLVALAVLRSRHAESAPAIDRALLDGAFGLVCMVAALALVWRMPRRYVSVLFAALALASVGALGSTAPVADRAIVDEAPPWATAIAAAQTGADPARVYRPKFMQDPARADRDRREPSAREAPAETLEDALATFGGASGWRFGVGVVRSDDPARSPDVDRAFLASSQEGGALLDRFGVRFVILPVDMTTGNKFRVLGVRNTHALVERPPLATTASVMRGWAWAREADNALGLTYPRAGGVGIHHGMTVLRGAGESRTFAGPPLPCSIARWQAGDIELDCTSDAPGYAVVSSGAADGWIADVDDQETPWATADVLRRAVPIESGTHHIRWRYAAPGLALGVALAIAAAVGLLGLWLAGRYWNKRP